MRNITIYRSTGLSPSSGNYIDPTSNIILSWVFKSTVFGDVQSAYNVQIKQNILGSTLTDTYWKLSNQSQHTITGGTLVIPASYAWRVRNSGTLSTNLLTANQSNFELGVTDWIANSGTTVTTDNSQKYEGNYSLKMVTASASDHYVNNSFYIPVLPNTQYTFSAYLNILSALTSGSASLKIIQRNASGSQVTTNTSTTKSSTVGWERITQTITTSATTTLIELRLQNAGIGTVYYDAIQFEKAGTASTFTTGSWNNSEWSDWVVFNTSNVPTCQIKYPVADNDTVINEFPTLTHSFTQTQGALQKNYQYKVYADNGTTVLWTSDLLTDADNLTVVPKGLLSNNTYYKAEVTVTDMNGVSAKSLKRRFYCNFVPTVSNSPDFTSTVDNAKSKVDLRWVNIKSKPFTYSGSGVTYSACKFGNGVRVQSGEKLYINIDIPEIFTIKNWCKFSTVGNGTLVYLYKDVNNYLRFYYDSVGQRFIVEKSVNGNKRFIGSPTIVLSNGTVFFYAIQQLQNGNIIVHTGINGGTLNKWGDV